VHPQNRPKTRFQSHFPLTSAASPAEKSIAADISAWAFKTARPIKETRNKPPQTFQVAQNHGTSTKGARAMMTTLMNWLMDLITPLASFIDQIPA